MSSKLGECVIEGCYTPIKYFVFHKKGFVAIPMCKGHAALTVKYQRERFGLQGQLRVVKDGEYPNEIDGKIIMWNGPGDYNE